MSIPSWEALVSIYAMLGLLFIFSLWVFFADSSWPLTRLTYKQKAILITIAIVAWPIVLGIIAVDDLLKKN